MQSDHSAVSRLKVIVESEPDALVRVLQLFQARDVIPLRVHAQRLGVGLLEIEIELDMTELSPDRLRMVIAKIGELPIAIATAAHEIVRSSRAVGRQD